MRHAWREITWQVDALWAPLFIASCLLFLAGWLFVVWFILFIEPPWKNAENPWRWVNPSRSIRAALRSLSQRLRDRGLGWLLGAWVAVSLFVLLWSLVSPTLCQKPGVQCGSTRN
jgi:hypothetical protein